MKPGTITFRVYEPLKYWDVEAAEMIEDRAGWSQYNGRIRSREDSTLSYSDLDKLMHAIFIDEVLEVRLCAAFMYTGDIIVPHHEEFDDDDAIAHPGLNKFEDMGSRIFDIWHLMESKEYIEAVNVCRGACSSINMLDYVIIEEFVAALYDTDKKCLCRKSDDALLTPTQAAEWLNSLS